MTIQLINRQEIKSDARALVLPIVARIRMMRASSAIRKVEYMQKQLEQKRIEQELTEMVYRLEVRC